MYYFSRFFFSLKYVKTEFSTPSIGCAINLNTTFQKTFKYIDIDFVQWHCNGRLSICHYDKLHQRLRVLQNKFHL